MQLFKASATGNDFILVDLLDGDQFTRDRARFVVAVCDRHGGVGADGVAFLEPSSRADVRWDFFNADGGGAAMCGNAARAVGLYVAEKLGRRELKLETTGGLVDVDVDSRERITVGLMPIGERRDGDGYVFVRAGVPHAVVLVPDARDWPALRARALAIKARPEFRAEGVNVTFATRPTAGVIDAVTFERGVEDFTLSCGTGAVAAAFACGGAERTEVRVPGGRLTVLCQPGRPTLIGPARLIARFDWLADEEN